MDAERRAALAGAKLAALVTGRWGAAERRRGAVGASATLVDTATGSGRAGRGWFLADAVGERALGPALVWADREGMDELHLVVDAADPTAPGVLARQAAYFADPPSVWVAEGTALAPATPEPTRALATAPAPGELVDLLIDAGVEIVVEGGMIRGEVEGLEVARIVQGHTTAGEPIDEPQLEVGVGKADRELTAMVHSGLPPVDQLARVVEIVRAQRRPDAARHPLNQLVPERWLRAVLCRTPGLVGLRSLRPAEGARPRPNLAERDIAVATGEAADGSPVVVACAVGIAPDLVPEAADARAVLDAGRPDRAPSRPAPSPLLLVVPARDDHPVVRRLADRLTAPARVIPVPDDWRAA